MHSSFHDAKPDSRAQRAEVLVRALVGIADVVVVADGAGDVARVHVVATPGSSPKQAMRNAASALLAGLGLRLANESITSVDAAALARIRAALAQRATDEAPSPPAVAAPADDAAADDVPPSPAAEEAPPAQDAASPEPPRAAANGQHANGLDANGRRANGNGNGRYASSPLPLRAGRYAPPRFGQNRLAAALPLPAQLAADGDDRPAAIAWIEGVDVRPASPGRVACHVTVAAYGHRFAGAGEAVDDGPAGRAGLVARVTIEAVRANMSNAGGLQFGGADFADVGGRGHVIVAIHLWRNGAIQDLAGASPILDRVEDAAARAALGALRELL